MKKIYEIVSNKNMDFLRRDYLDFEIHGIETMHDSPNIHILDNTYTIFADMTIIIYYEQTDFLKAVEQASIRFLDPHFNANFLEYSNKKLFYSDSLNEESVYIFLLENFSSKSIKISIRANDVKSFDYSSGVLLYKITSDHEDSYYLNQEFDRWLKILKNIK